MCFAQYPIGMKGVGLSFVKSGCVSGVEYKLKLVRFEYGSAREEVKSALAAVVTDEKGVPLLLSYNDSSH